MDNEPDMSLDAAALFRHMRKIGWNAEEYQRWSFQFCADDVEPLQEFAEFLHPLLHELFFLILQDSVTEHGPNGQKTEGPPMLRLEFIGVIDEPTLAGMHERLAPLAAERDLRYEGVATYSEAPLNLGFFDAAMEME